MWQRLKLVVIDCPIKHWEHPLVPELFQKIVRLKLAGFHSKMPDNYLPVDTFDYIGTHIVVCKENEDGCLNPIMGFKAVTLERCLYYGQNFAGRGCISSAKSEIHKNTLEQYINSSLSKGHSLAYISSFAVDPRIEGKEKYETIKLLFAFLTFYYREFNLSRLIALGAVRTKTHITFQRLGFFHLSHEGKVLSGIQNPSLQNEEVVVMILERISAECESEAIAKQELWDKRIEISNRLAGVNTPVQI